MGQRRGKTYYVLDSRGRRRWYFYIFPAGRRIRKGAWDTRAEAQAALEEFEGKIEKSNGNPPQDIRFHDLCGQYLGWAEVNLAARTRSERECTIRAHLKPFLDCTAREVSFQLVEAYKRKRTRDGIAPSTLNTELKALSCILRYAVDCGYLEEIPKIRRVKVPKTLPKFLSAEEIGRVLAAAWPNVRPMLQLMIFTGLRKGEIRHLEWSDVDLENRLLHVRPKETWNPKTDNSARTIPLCEPALEALRMARARAEKKAKSSLVFPGRKGGPLNDVRESLNGACKRAGVPHIHVHGLRHTFGSQMAMAGADPFAIMKAMGHADIKTTMIYISLGRSHIREQVERLNGISLYPSVSSISDTIG